MKLEQFQEPKISTSWDGKYCLYFENKVGKAFSAVIISEDEWF
jgi:hypothetical protein